MIQGILNVIVVYLFYVRKWLNVLPFESTLEFLRFYAWLIIPLLAYL